MLAGCHNGGHKLRQTGTKSNDRKTDQILAHSEESRNGRCRIHDKLTAPCDGCRTTDNIENTLPDRTDLIFILIRCTLTARLLCRTYHPEKEACKKHQQDHTVNTSQCHADPAKHHQQQSHKYRKRKLSGKGRAADCQRTKQCAHTTYDHQVKDIGADCITDSHSGITG